MLRLCTHSVSPLACAPRSSRNGRVSYRHCHAQQQKQQGEDLISWVRPSLRLLLHGDSGMGLAATRPLLSRTPLITLPPHLPLSLPAFPTSSSQEPAQSQLELLEKLTSGREKVDGDKNTIGEQLSKKVVVNTEDEIAIPLGKQNPLEYDDLTMAQKRNIRRQKYLDQVSKRNDAPFFAAIVLFVVLPPAVILGVAVATGYINFLP